MQPPKNSRSLAGFTPLTFRVRLVTPVMEPRRLTEVKVFLASPGDVTPEREALSRVVEELASDLRDEHELAVRLVRWETDGRPGVGVDAQDVLNRQLPPGDIVVVVLWNRLGTPTLRAASGTVEEFEAAYERWRTEGAPLLVYFKTAAATLDTKEAIDQRRRVVEFRDSLKGRGGVLSYAFDSTPEFERLARPHLRSELTQWARKRQVANAEVQKREDAHEVEAPSAARPPRGRSDSEPPVQTTSAASSVSGGADAQARVERFYSFLVSLFDQVARLERPVALPGFFNCTKCVTVIDARREDEGPRENGPTPPSRSWDSILGANQPPYVLLMAEHALTFDIPRVWICAAESDDNRDALISELTQDFARDAPGALVMPLTMKEAGAEAVNLIESDRIGVLGSPSAVHDPRFYSITDPAGVRLMRAAVQRLTDAQEAAGRGWEDALGDD